MDKKSFNASLAHPYSAPAKNPPPKPSTTPTNTVKYHFLGD